MWEFTDVRETFNWYYLIIIICVDITTWFTELAVSNISLIRESHADKCLHDLNFKIKHSLKQHFYLLTYLTTRDLYYVQSDQTATVSSA